jgi:hypothetical protein
MAKSKKKKGRSSELVSQKERRFNEYDMASHKDHEIGIIIGDQGYKVCDEDINLCPIAGVPTLNEAEKLQSLMSGDRADRRVC